MSNRKKWFQAARENDVSTLKLLLDDDVDIEIRNTWGETALLVAVKNINREAVQFLIDQQADTYAMDDSKQNAAYLAVQHENVEMLKLLINKGFEVDALNEERITPLLYAAIMGYSQCILPLLEAGANFDVKLNANKTVLEHAKEGGRQEIVDIIESFVDNKTLVLSITKNSQSEHSINF